MVPAGKKAEGQAGPSAGADTVAQASSGKSPPGPSASPQRTKTPVLQVVNAEAGEGCDPERLELVAALLSSGESRTKVLMSAHDPPFSQKEVTAAARVHGLHVPKEKPGEKEAYEKWRGERREKAAAERTTKAQRRAQSVTIKGVETGVLRKQRDMALDLGGELAAEWEEIRKSCLSEWRRAAEEDGKPLKDWLQWCVEGWTKIAPAQGELRETLIMVARRNEALTTTLNTVLDEREARREAVFSIVRLVGTTGRPLTDLEIRQFVAELTAHLRVPAQSESAEDAPVTVQQESTETGTGGS